ncbi:MAG: cytochrome c1 [Gammaproteobacteria bacterium]
MRRASPFKTAVAAFASAFALAFAPQILAAGTAVNLPQPPVGQGDVEAMQRGAAVFVNYCMGCHSMQYMRYGRLAEDLKINEAQVEKFLIHNSAGLGDGMQSAMSPEDGKEWFSQAAPPDLSLSARLRGEDWIYAYLRGFYRDPARPTGWNNTLFENAAMPHALAALQGVYERNAETGALEQVSEGRLSPAEYDALAGDVAAFMAYAGEPVRGARRKTGALVMAFLFLLLPATYFLYREYWKDIH